MDYSEVLSNARKLVAPNCKACPVCNGIACGATMPGPGCKGSGTVARRNYEAWQRVCVNMDTLYEGKPVDTSFELFGQTFALPVFAGPVGAVQLHYGDRYTDAEYNEILVSACANAGIAAFVGDGTDASVLEAGAAAIKAADGCGIPTIKPWDLETIREKAVVAANSGAFAIAMDVDAAGLPFLQNKVPPAGPKSAAELKEIVQLVGKPFIVKGVMTPAAAQKACDAGAQGIIVSNHGGRVLDGTPATADVLPAIAKAVRGRAKVFVDGGIRSGLDVFRALALGADAVLIARPFVTAVYGAEGEGIGVLVEKIRQELEDTMRMTGACTLADISADKVFSRGDC